MRLAAKAAAAAGCALLVWGLVANGQAVSHTIAYLVRIYAIDAPLDIVGGVETEPVRTGRIEAIDGGDVLVSHGVRTPDIGAPDAGVLQIIGSGAVATSLVSSLLQAGDGGLLVLDGGGVVIPCAASLPSCSSTTNRGAQVRLCSTDTVYTCSIVTASIGYAWQVGDGIQRYVFASRIRAGQSTPEEGDHFSSSTPFNTNATIVAVECFVSSQGSGAGQAVVEAVQDGGSKCKFNFPCTQVLGAAVPLDGGIWQGPFICQPNTLDQCTPPGPCSTVFVHFAPESNCAVNGLPGVSCDAVTRRYLKVP
jgi:hypothetical protein